MKVSVRQGGALNRPALVLLHALGNDSSSYEYQFEALAESYHVVAWDAPGYGNSDAWPDRAVAPEGLSRLLAATLEFLLLSSTCIVASSFGSLLALQLAARRPDLVSCLVLASPSIGLGARPAGEREAMHEQRRGLGDLPATEFAGKFAPLLVAKSAPAALVDRARFHGEVFKREGYLAALETLVQADGLKLARSVHQPTLVIAGSEDQLSAPKDSAEPLSRALDHCALRILDGIGHSPHIEDPHAFNQEILKFAAAHLARANAPSRNEV